MPPRFDKLLVLDLDETLIHATERPLSRPADYVVGPYSIYRRPGVGQFLERCLELFEVGIWTASTRDYALPAIEPLLDIERLAFVWGRERCTLRRDMDTYELERIKDIRKLRRRGYRRESIIFVDDTPAKIQRSYGNYIRVREFEGDLADRELELLARYLERLGPEPNVRSVDKRGWRVEVEG